MNRRRAFSLVEMIVALSMLGFVLVAGGQLFRSTVMLSTDSSNLSNHSFQIDSALDQMRRDVWGCTSIQVSDAHHAQLGAIAWSVSSDGAVHRTDASGKTMTWPSISATWALSSDGPWLTVSDKASHDWQAVRLVSQAMLLEGRP
jgi:prepilin-type N-terminal cleavage/methylation domain-containing protein